MKILIKGSGLTPYYYVERTKKDSAFIPCTPFAEVTLEEWKDYLWVNKEWKKWQSRLRNLKVEGEGAFNHRKKEAYMKTKKYREEQDAILLGKYRRSRKSDENN